MNQNDSEVLGICRDSVNENARRGCRHCLISDIIAKRINNRFPQPFIRAILVTCRPLGMFVHSHESRRALMADYIPFLTSEESCTLTKTNYPDAAAVRVPIERMKAIRASLPSGPLLWVDTACDGLEKPNDRKPRPGRPNEWYDFVLRQPGVKSLADASNHAKPLKADVAAFVSSMMDAAAAENPDWITFPQLPLVNGNGRNKINRALAAAAGTWKSKTGFKGKLVLPIVVTKVSQIIGKTERNPKVAQAVACLGDSGAEIFWAVDSSLQEHVSARSLKDDRYPAVIGLHEELKAKLENTTTVGGPYWALNLILWSRQLVTHPAIGVASGYQYQLSGGFLSTPTPRLAIPSLKRRAVADAQLKTWLGDCLPHIPSTLPVARAEFQDLRTNFQALRSRAKQQVAEFYKRWYDSLTPLTTAASTNFNDTSAAYQFGKKLPDIPNEEASRRPESIVDAIMNHAL
ncbi:MAG: hypothetical protein WBC44_19975 [Planctomycetaceae bacterium]